MKVLGLMSGTSADGIDAVLADFDGSSAALQWRLLSHTHVDFAPALREEILAACTPAGSSVDRLCRLNFAFGEALAGAVMTAAREAAIPLSQIDLVGSHGQTVWHDVDDAGRVTATLQIGEPAVIAERVGVPVVADFRVADVAAGGQGAPLVPFADYILFRDATKFRAVQNIGGIANVTLLAPGCAPHEVIAFDSGPGNMVIDALVAHMTDGREAYDRDGRIAASGRVDGGWLEERLDQPYFRRQPPKTTGRELFGQAYAREFWAQGSARGLAPADIVATATALTAQSIADALRHPLPGRAPAEPDELILGGGGAHNATLVRMIGAQLMHTRIMRHEDFGIAAQAKEAFAFAILAYCAWRGEPNNLPSVTGARRAVVMGKIVKP
ncbi:MAG: anhydro-N-acetylmuramic acid kinase [Chloroflexi bacterium]|nr:anhydro-N-acetylmuramic acid kinase [Chloroflexota bacterium]